MTFKFKTLKQAESQVSFAKNVERNSLGFESGRVFPGQAFEQTQREIRET